MLERRLAAVLAAVLPRHRRSRGGRRPCRPRRRSPTEKFVLDNGLTLIVHEDHKAPIVAVNVWYHVGSKNEKRGKTGFAHLFEHLMFNGCENFNDDYFKALRRRSAPPTSTAPPTRTAPTTSRTCRRRRLDVALWHGVGPHGAPARRHRPGEARRAARRGAEREAPGREPALRQGLPAPDRENVYPAGHPYSLDRRSARWTTSTRRSLDDVHEWFKTYYGPANAVLVVAGDVDARRTCKAKVEKYFGDIPPGPPVASATASGSPRRTGEHRGSRCRTACPRPASTRSGTSPQCGLHRRRRSSTWSATC